MIQPLLTKLIPPQLTTSQVQREALLDQLNQASKTARLILISAQAGAGKTTLLGQWANSHSDIVWLTVDKADNDPARFWSYIINAFSFKFPVLSGVCQQLLELLHTSQLVSQPVLVETILTELINATLQQPAVSSKDICLVLDDYHLVDNRVIHQALSSLLDFLPGNLHLLIASRSDPELPLARLRARGQLVEFRAEDLRFSAEEASFFYNSAMQLGLSGEQIVALEKRTEGWVAGMQLLALSLRGLTAPKRAEFIRSFSGTHRYIIDYLAQETLQNLPEELQQFLLQTSILEKLNGELCEAVVTPETPENSAVAEPVEKLTGQLRLEKLAAENLFISRLDEQGEWFRYHQLFAAVLQQRLARTYPPNFRQILHQRAANWFRNRGWYEEAANHYFAAQSYTEAAELLTGSLREWWQRGELLNLIRWIEKIPEQLRKSYPLLELTRAWPLVLTGQTARIRQILDDLEPPHKNTEVSNGSEAVSGETSSASTHAKTADFDANTLAQIDFLRGNLAIGDARWDEARRHFEAALPVLLQNANQGQALPWWLLALMSLGWVYRFTGQLEKAGEVYDGAIAICRANRIFTALPDAIGYRTELDEEAGKLNRAARIYHQSIAEAQEKLGSGLPRLYSSSLYAGLGRVYYQWNELDEATNYFNQALHYSRLDQNLPIIIQALEGLARVALARGATDEVQGLLAEMEEEAQDASLVELRLHLQALKARFRLRQGQLEPAKAWAEELVRQHPDYLKLPATHLREIRLLTLARVWLAEGKTAPLLELLARQLEIALSLSQQSVAIEIYLLQALALYPRPEAFSPLEKALSLAAPENYLRLFLDEGLPVLNLLQSAPASLKDSEFVKKLLLNFNPTPPKAASAPVSPELRLVVAAPASSALLQGQFEPLSEREKEVLEGLANGLSNRALAAKLVVTENTVKVHVRNIFSKLAVNSRTQALARAKELDLL
jgi:LuxR family maltose regulon positive regulatory protein